MHIVPRTACVAAIWFAMAAPPVAAADNPKAAAAIRANSGAFLKAYNAGDVDAVLTHFEETAVVMPPGAPPVRGRAEIRRFVEKGIAGAKANAITIALGSSDEIGVSGDLAWHSGPYSIGKSGTPIDAGKYLETWHKAGGQWRMIRRIWSSNTPAPGAASAPATAPK